MRFPEEFFFATGVVRSIVSEQDVYFRKWGCSLQDVISFDDIALYFGWIRSGPTRARYLPEWVIRQFGYVQSDSRHPDRAASIVTTNEQIDQHLGVMRIISWLLRC
jgi:hypothetical protein